MEHLSIKRCWPILLAAPLAACTTIALRSTASLIENGVSAFYEESDPELAREAMPGQLKLLDSLLVSNPGNERLLRTAAEGYVGYAFLFLEGEQPARAAALYERAAGYGLRLLEAEGWGGIGRMKPEELEAALGRAGEGDVPALYWTAYALAAWANLDKNDAEALSGVPKAVRMMRRVLELDPAYQYGGADQFFGVYYCARPRIAGGDPEKGKAHFEAAIARTQGRFLTAKVLTAKYYATAVLDEDLFRRLNREVLDADPAALPEARLANETAKLKSKKLMESIDDLF